MIAPKKYKDVGHQIGGYTNLFAWIPCTLFDRKYRKNNVLPFQIANSIDLSRDFTADDSRHEIFKNYTFFAMSPGLVIKKLKNIVQNSVRNSKIAWKSFINNGRNILSQIEIYFC